MTDVLVAAPLRVGSELACLRVGIVEDHAVVREGLCSLLDGVPGITVAGDAADVEEACRLVAGTRLDVLLLDLRLGDDDGVALIPRLRELAPGLRVLVLSAHGGAEQLRAALAAGADGYLMKHTPAVELLRGIRRVHEGETVVDPEFVPQLLDYLADEAIRPGLTAREHEVLELVADGATAGQVGRRLGISERTVSKHLENLYRKLEVHSRTELVAHAFTSGLLH